jgi:predicted dehydrogenase
MNKGNMSRRGFLARSLAGLTVGAGLPAWFAQDLLAEQQQEQARQARQPNGPNDRIVMAAIGVGTNYTRRGSGQLHGERGVHIMEDARRQRGVQFVAVCDVDRHNRDHAARLVGRDCRAFEDFRQVLQNRDINAITIGTPDHWHSLIAAAAMRAGKDVYCEKPLTLTVDEGKGLVRVQRATNKIFQTGSQQRTEFGGRFRLAAELVRNGRLGRVHRITTLIGANPRGGPFAAAAPPDGLNWDFWLGQTSRVDYVPQRCFYEFRWWYEYSGGKMTDWGAHHNDIAQWALGMDGSGPVAVEGRGEMPDRRPNCYNCHPTFEATYTYANGPGGAMGTRLICRNGPPDNFPARRANGSRYDNGVLFEGEDNKWIFVDRGTIVASDGDAMTSRLLSERLPAGATRLPVSNSQMGNFLECVRSRQQPICNVNVGHRSATVCHLGNIAIRTGRSLRWDPAQERFTGANADEGNRMLSREMRGEWGRFWQQQVGES